MKASATSIVVQDRAQAAALREQGIAVVAKQVQVEHLVGLFFAVDSSSYAIAASSRIYCAGSRPEEDITDRKPGANSRLNSARFVTQSTGFQDRTERIPDHP